MVRTCSALYCNHRDTAENRKNGMTFHLFPKDLIARNAWAKATKREGVKKGTVWAPPAYTYLCSDHFTSSDFEVEQQTRRLRSGAVPSIFVFEKPEKVERRRRRSKPAKSPLKPKAVPSRSSSGTSNAPIALDDHCYSHVDDTANRLKRKIENIKDVREETRIKTLRTTKRQLAVQTTPLSKLLKELPDLKLLSESDKNILEHSFGDLELEMFTGTQTNEYSEAMKQFACALHVYSPKAYDHLQETLHLPSIQTLQEWMENTDGNPGMAKSAIDFLKRQVDKRVQAFKYCTVIMDSMALRRHAEWDEKENKMVGLIDYGNGCVDDDALPLASEAMVVMAVGVLGRWKVPLAYFLVDGVSGQVRTSLVRKAIQRLLDIKIVVVGFVCDGHYANQQTVTMLGAKLDPNDPCCTMSIVSNEEEFKVPIMLDSCHMMKMLGNLFADYKLLRSRSGSIDWAYIVKLHTVQGTETLPVPNVHYPNKMKVIPAAKLFSYSVSSALDHCKISGFAGFMRVNATAEFIKTIHRVLDILNTRNVFAKGFRSPISKKNWFSTQKFLVNTKAYLLSLTDSKNEPLHSGRRKTSILGFVNNIDSIIWLYERYVLNTECPIKYLLTCKWSLDHLQVFFGCVRQCGRSNDNPSARKFRSIFRKMMFRSGVSPSSVTYLDDACMISVNGREDVGKGEAAVEILESLREDQSCAVRSLTDLSAVLEDVISYIAGLIARKLLVEADCDFCLEAITGNKDNKYLLTAIKDDEGLMYPSSDLLKVVRTCERVLRWSANASDLNKNSSVWGLKLENDILHVVLEEKNVFPYVAKVCDKYRLLKRIVQCFLRIRRHYVAKTFTINLQVNAR